jgi:hypothetical protein
MLSFSGRNNFNEVRGTVLTGEYAKQNINQQAQGNFILFLLVAIE